MFKKIVIANRGEIACRIIRTARQLGIITVAVYSDADAQSLHVQMANEAWYLGPSEASESYLMADKLIEVALNSEAQAIHPGYGFLSENADFAEACDKAGVTFIGPSAASIRAMGLKDAAKSLMETAGVPVVPGYHGNNQDPDFLSHQADTIGYPVLIKAVAGGGGKGMRQVNAAVDFKEALEGAQREGLNSFADSKVLIEKYIEQPRHVEIQIFADGHGNAIHLFERDCSLQRRHQKVIEEAPAPGMPEDVRRAMGDAAIKSALAISYCGAGTVEFIVDGSQGLRADGFWFMEMNTRLQVEHPVTEMITGQDLVAWQINVASGGALPIRQDELAINGHAFEARIYAEDVAKGFMPATGTLRRLTFPDRSSTVRIDTGVCEGDTISPFYDPMIAKLIVHGDTRREALGRLLSALKSVRVDGCATNVSFLIALTRHEGFCLGQFDTQLIERDLESLLQGSDKPPSEVFVAAILYALGGLDKHAGTEPWDQLNGFRLWGGACQFAHLDFSGEAFEFPVTFEGGRYHIQQIGTMVPMVPMVSVGVVDCASNQITLDFGDRRLKFEIAPWHGGLTVFYEGHTWCFDLPDRLIGEHEMGDTTSDIRASLPGVVIIVHTVAGDTVKQGDALMVIEAMKMEHIMRAPRDGVVADVRIRAGDQVEEGALLLTLADGLEDGLEEGAGGA